MMEACGREKDYLGEIFDGQIVALCALFVCFVQLFDCKSLKKVESW